MAKRFTDSNKWKKPLIRSLKAPYKLLWLYILDDCDHAGIWDVDLDVAQIRIGESLDLNEAINSFGDKIRVIDGGAKWFIADFIEFQYGELDPKNRVHESVLKVIKKYQIKTLISPLQGVKDKDKEKDMDKEKDKEGKKLVHPFQTPTWLSTWDRWIKYRSQIKKTYKSHTTEQEQLQWFIDNKYNEAQSIEIINKSIRNEYQGLFELNKQSTNGSTQKHIGSSAAAGQSQDPRNDYAANPRPS